MMSSARETSLGERSSESTCSEILAAVDFCGAHTVGGRATWTCSAVSATVCCGL